LRNGRGKRRKSRSGGLSALKKEKKKKNEEEEKEVARIFYARIESMLGPSLRLSEKVGGERKVRELRKRRGALLINGSRN
jgi:hypothetical protein